jgi:acetolactate synthase-1/2/3 large subunit
MAVRAALGDEAIATSDTGAHKFLVSQLWETRSKGSFFVSNGLSSMGFGIPVAAAARLARPEQPVVAFLGDGGLSMYQGELATLQRLGLDLTIVVFADGSLEMIRRSQVQRGVAEEGTSFHNPDLVAVAAAYGVKAWAARSQQELQLALDQAQRPGGVKMIVALINGADYRL